MTHLSDIARLLGVATRPGEDCEITGIATLVDAGPTELSFLGSDQYLKQFAPTRAAAVMVQMGGKLPADANRPVLLVDYADLVGAIVL
jgi:UDP-3-O-[3-hydroxymyristoyl] glucosamine N-acyltransferase